MMNPGNRDTGFHVITALPPDMNYLSEVGFGVVHFVCAGLSTLPVLLNVPHDHVIPMIVRYFYSQAGVMLLRMPVYTSTTFPSTKYDAGAACRPHASG